MTPLAERLSSALHAPFSASSGCDELGIENDLVSFNPATSSIRKRLIAALPDHAARIKKHQPPINIVELWNYCG